MAKKVTTRKGLSGNNRSHALNATKKTQKIYLQKIKLNNKKYIRISTRELRTLKKQAAA